MGILGWVICSDCFMRDLDVYNKCLLCGPKGNFISCSYNLVEHLVLMSSSAWWSWLGLSFVKSIRSFLILFILLILKQIEEPEFQRRYNHIMVDRLGLLFLLVHLLCLLCPSNIFSNIWHPFYVPCPISSPYDYLCTAGWEKNYIVQFHCLHHLLAHIIELCLYTERKS